MPIGADRILGTASSSRATCSGHRCKRVEGVKLVQIDIVSAEALEAGLARPHDLVAEVPLSFGPGPWACRSLWR
jgi:hypothetical protein